MNAMKPIFDVLEIAAVLKYLRPVPGYMAIDCELTVRAFVDGGCPVEKELSELEAFRKTVIRLAGEGLARPPECGIADEPFVGLKLLGGECHQEPELEFHVSLGLERWGDRDVWALHWRNEEDRPVGPMFPEAGRALDMLKCLLDQKTGQWASFVPFQTDRVDS
ncbi:MAG: hypothetical protein HYX59_05840 [Elusimicrobia bacterium]|nr:hypothetical protein [Elusimicrobiota bacterium]